MVRAGVAVARAEAALSAHARVDQRQQADGEGAALDDCLQQLNATANALATAAVLVPAAPLPALDALRPRNTTLARALAHAQRMCGSEDAAARGQPPPPAARVDGDAVVASLSREMRRFGIARPVDGTGTARAAANADLLHQIPVPSMYFEFPTVREWRKLVARASPQVWSCWLLFVDLNGGVGGALRSHLVLCLLSCSTLLQA